MRKLFYFSSNIRVGNLNPKFFKNQPSSIFYLLLLSAFAFALSKRHFNAFYTLSIKGYEKYIKEIVNYRFITYYYEVVFQYTVEIYRYVSHTYICVAITYYMFDVSLQHRVIGESISPGTIYH